MLYQKTTNDKSNSILTCNSEEHRKIRDGAFRWPSATAEVTIRIIQAYIRGQYTKTTKLERPFTLPVTKTVGNSRIQPAALF